MTVANTDISSITNKAGKDSTLATMTNENYFKSFFGGMTKAEVKLEAQKNGVVLNSCPTSATGKKIIWIEGDLSGNCAISDSDVFVVINGNVNGAVTALSGAFIYANNLLQSGSMNVVGSVAIEGVIDAAVGNTISAGSLTGVNAGRPFSDMVNNKNDFEASGDQQVYGSALGSLTMSYKKIRYDSPPGAGNSTRTGSWIDF